MPTRSGKRHKNRGKSSRYWELSWDPYCAFLELETEEFTDIQDRLLLEQLQLVRHRPLCITVLPVGAFPCYYDLKRAAGVPLTDRRPARMNAGPAVIADLQSAVCATERLAG